MARLIDADNLVAGIEKLKKSGCFSSNTERILLNTILTVITMSKTIDHVKHGEWINRSPLGTAICSICGYCADSVYADRYCRHCGARMDGDNV